MKRLLIVGILLVLILPALSACAKGTLDASNIWSNACKAGDDCSVFMKITNPTGEADVLLSATSDVAERVELHKVVQDPQGGLKMSPVENIPVPAAGTVELRPGARHVMLFRLQKDLKTGDVFPLTLKYQKSGDVTVQVTVQAPN